MRNRPAVLVLAVGLIAVACDSAESRLQNPNWREPFINGYLYKVKYVDGSVDHDKSIVVTDIAGLRMVPIVELNGRRVEVYYYGATSYRYGDDSTNQVMTRSELTVDHYWGRAFAHATMPGDFRLVEPGGGFILNPESALVLAWTGSAAAQWYWVSLVVDYDYLDSLGDWDDYEFTLDTLVYDLSLVLPPERVFPGFVRRVTEGDGSLVVWSGNGPAVEPGDVGNVRGVGFGFFSAINEPSESYFYVGAPPLHRRVPSREGQSSRFRSLLLTRGRAD